MTPPGEPFVDAAGARAHEEALALEVLEHALELERLEVRERQVSAAEDSLACREVKAEQEVDQKVAGIRQALVCEYCRKLGLQELRFKQRRAELRGQVDSCKAKLAAAEQREKAAEDAWAISEAELLSLQQ